MSGKLQHNDGFLVFSEKCLRSKSGRKLNHFQTSPNVNSVIAIVRVLFILVLR